MSSLVYDRHEFEAARARMLHSPASLTDHDVALLGLVDSTLAQRAQVMRSAVLAPSAASPAQAKHGPHSPRPLTTSAADFDMLATAVVDVLQAVLMPVIARVKALETQPALKFVGPFRDGTQYLAGSITQRQGLWLAESDTHATPGEENSGWRLILKVAK